MFKPVHRAQVDEKTVSRIVRLIDFLAKITPPNEHPTLQNFIQAFQSRYEEAEVPLAVALDGELGLGYPVSSGSGDVNPLINDLVFPGRYSNAVTVTQTPADRILFENISKMPAKEATSYCWRTRISRNWTTNISFPIRLPLCAACSITI